MSQQLTNFVLLLLVVFFVAGFVRGWFEVSTKREPESPKVNFVLTVDTDKLRSDLQAWKTKASEMTGVATKKDSGDDQKTASAESPKT